MSQITVCSITKPIAIGDYFIGMYSRDLFIRTGWDQSVKVAIVGDRPHQDGIRRGVGYVATFGDGGTRVEKVTITIEG